MSSFFFFFNDTATTEIYTLSLHDALPILPDPVAERHAPGPRDRLRHRARGADVVQDRLAGVPAQQRLCKQDRKSTRLNSSHLVISYAVFCLKKKKKVNQSTNAVPALRGLG